MGFFSKTTPSAAAGSCRRASTIAEKELLQMYGEFMIEHSTSLITDGLSAEDDEDPDGAHVTVPESANPFADDYVENTRAIDGNEYHLYTHIPNTAVRQSGGAIDPVEEFRREVAELGIDVEMKDLDVLFDADEELNKLENPAPVVELDPEGVAQQFRDLPLFCNGEPQGMAVVEAKDESDTEMSLTDVASCKRRDSSPVGTFLSIADSAYGSFKECTERETDPAFLDAADVALWDESTRQMIINIFESEEMVLGMDYGFQIASSKAPKKELSVDTLVKNPTRTRSRLIARRFEKYKATATVDTPALHRGDDDDDFLTFEDVFIPSHDVEVGGHGDTWLDDEVGLAGISRFVGESGIHLGSLVRVVEDTGDVDDVDHLMSPEEEQLAFTVKGAKGNHSWPAVTPGAKLVALPKPREQWQYPLKDIMEISKNDAKARGRSHSADITAVRTPVTKEAIADGSDESRYSVSYFDTNVQRYAPYTALNMLYSSKK